MGEVDRAGSERSRPRREQAVEDEGIIHSCVDPLTLTLSRMERG